jgi:hypothetical protein
LCSAKSGNRGDGQHGRAQPDNAEALRTVFQAYKLLDWREESLDFYQRARAAGAKLSDAELEAEVDHLRLIAEKF